MISLSLSQLTVSPDNVRRIVKGKDVALDEGIDELAQSIKSEGLLNPLSVRPIGGPLAATAANAVTAGQRGDSGQRYEVFAGQRRLCAVKRLGWKEVNCIVWEIDKNQAKVRSLLENYQRRDNTYTERIRAFHDIYRNVCQEDPKRLSGMIGCKLATIRRYMRLNELPDAILRLLDPQDGEKRLTLKNADLLVDVQTDKRQPLIDAILESDLSNRLAGELISRFTVGASGDSGGDSGSGKTPDVDAIPGLIRELLEAQIKSKRREQEAQAQDGDPDPGRSEEAEGGDPTSAPTAPGSGDKADNNGSADDGMVGEEEKEKPVSKRMPWIYDPGDKHKRPVAIPPEHLDKFWKLHSSLVQKGE